MVSLIFLKKVIWVKPHFLKFKSLRSHNKKNEYVRTKSKTNRFYIFLLFQKKIYWLVIFSRCGQLLVNAKYFTNSFSKSAFNLDPSPSCGINVGDIFSETKFYHLSYGVLFDDWLQTKHVIYLLWKILNFWKKCSK